MSKKKKATPPPRRPRRGPRPPGSRPSPVSHDSDKDGIRDEALWHAAGQVTMSQPEALHLGGELPWFPRTRPKRKFNRSPQLNTHEILRRLRRPH